MKRKDKKYIRTSRQYFPAKRMVEQRLRKKLLACRKEKYIEQQKEVAEQPQVIVMEQVEQAVEDFYAILPRTPMKMPHVAQKSASEKSAHNTNRPYYNGSDIKFDKYNRKSKKEKSDMQNNKWKDWGERQVITHKQRIQCTKQIPLSSADIDWTYNQVHTFHLMTQSTKIYDFCEKHALNFTWARVFRPGAVLESEKQPFNHQKVAYQACKMPLKIDAEQDVSYHKVERYTEIYTQKIWYTQEYPVTARYNSPVMPQQISTKAYTQDGISQNINRPLANVKHEKFIVAQRRYAYTKMNIAKPQYQRLQKLSWDRTRKNIVHHIKVVVEKVGQMITHSGITIVAGLVFLVFLLLFGAVGGLVTSPFGVFFSSQETSPEARSVRAAIAETNNEYFDVLNQMIQSTPHDMLQIIRVPEGGKDTQIHSWEEILAIFAVQTTTDPIQAMDVVKLDNERIQKLKDIFWKMVSITHKTEVTKNEKDKKVTLSLMITTKPAQQMAQELKFSKVQTGALEELLANRAWLTELVGQATGTSEGGNYEVPPQALEDEKFAAMIAEAEKYIGYPYVWGGSSPSTSFDCSGFVSWVINQSGVGSVGRQTAQGLYDLCTPVSKTQARPGDLVFFTGTYDSAGPVSHIGIFVGDGKMIHAGDPIQYTGIETAYWQKHFYSFGRI